jgi:transcriptional regulator GlxA family with amidase domain
MTARPVRVGVLAFDGCFGAEVFGVVDVLGVANKVVAVTGGGEPFAVSVIAARPGHVTTASGTALGPTPHRSVDLLVVPGFDYLPGADLDRLLGGWRAETALLRRTAARGVAIASVCGGAFLLGEAGLLAGRRATTAWIAADALAERYPATTVVASEMLVEDGPITTVAAFSAALDLGLHLVHRYAGEAAARRTARVALVPPGRESQTPYVDRGLLGERGGGFAAMVRAHLLAHLAEPYDLTALSRSFHVSTRTMLRRFGAEADETPLTFLQAARVARAQRLLESTDLAVAEVMRAIGYRDARTFRQLFVERVGLGPAAYRQAFRSSAAARASSSVASVSAARRRSV